MLKEYNRSTIVKKYEVYLSYLKMVQANKDSYPGIAEYIARAYYYDRLAEEFGITSGYAGDIVSEVIKAPEQWQGKYNRLKIDG